MFHRHNYLKWHRKLCAKQWWAGISLDLDIVAVFLFCCVAVTFTVCLYVMHLCETAWFDIAYTPYCKKGRKKCIIPHHRPSFLYRILCLLLCFAYIFFAFYYSDFDMLQRYLKCFIWALSSVTLD